MGAIQLKMTETLVFQLPELPDRNRSEAHWWLVADGAVVDSGAGAEWTAMLADEASGRRRQVALAPAAAVRLSRAPRSASAATRAQAEAVANVAAADSSLGDRETLHVVSAGTDDPSDPIRTAVVDNGLMLAWLDWAQSFGADPSHIVPTSGLLPPSEQWLEARFGTDHVVGRNGLVLPFEPELAAALVGDAEVTSLSPKNAEAIIADAAIAPPIDLRSGRFARRARFAIDRDRVRQLAVLAALALLLTLAWAAATLIKLDRSTDRLNDETLAIAEAALGRPVALGNAEAELRARVGGQGYGGFRPMLAALYNSLQADAAVSSSEISYRSDGTMSITLAAATVDPINRLLLALQRDGYRVTAVPRQAPDGRTMVDITIRSGP
jgi:general secretion pathway protein L